MERLPLSKANESKHGEEAGCLLDRSPHKRRTKMFNHFLYVSVHKYRSGKRHPTYKTKQCLRVSFSWNVSGGNGNRNNKLSICKQKKKGYGREVRNLGVSNKPTLQIVPFKIAQIPCELKCKLLMTVTCNANQQIHSFFKYRGLKCIFLIRNGKYFYNKLIQI